MVGVYTNHLETADSDSVGLDGAHEYPFLTSCQMVLKQLSQATLQVAASGVAPPAMG